MYKLIIKKEKITQTKNIYYDIKNGEPYSFTISNRNYLYCFSSEEDKIFYIEKRKGSYESMPNKTVFRNNDIIYVNMEKK